MSRRHLRQQNDADRLIVAERERKAVAARRQGFTYAEIAAVLGYADASGARRAVMRALDRFAVEDRSAVGELRALELARLDEMQSALWSQATQGDLRAVDTVLKIIDRRVRLLGLDVPVQHEEITIDQIDRDIAALREQFPELEGVVPPHRCPARRGQEPPGDHRRADR